MLNSIIIQNFPALAPVATTRGRVGPPVAARSGAKAASSTPTVDTTSLTLVRGFDGQKTIGKFWYPSMLGNCCKRVTRGAGTGTPCKNKVNLNDPDPIKRVFCNKCANLKTQQNFWEKLMGIYGNDVNAFLMDCQKYAGATAAAAPQAGPSTIQPPASKDTINVAPYPPGTNDFIVTPEDILIAHQAKTGATILGVLDRASGNLTPLTEEQKTYWREVKGCRNFNDGQGTHYSQFTVDGTLKATTPSSIINQAAAPPKVAVPQETQVPGQLSANAPASQAAQVPIVPQINQPPQQFNQQPPQVATMPPQQVNQQPPQVHVQSAVPTVAQPIQAQ